MSKVEPNPRTPHPLDEPRAGTKKASRDTVIESARAALSSETAQASDLEPHVGELDRVLAEIDPEFEERRAARRYREGAR